MPEEYAIAALGMRGGAAKGEGVQLFPINPYRCSNITSKITQYEVLYYSFFCRLLRWLFCRLLLLRRSLEQSVDRLLVEIKVKTGEAVHVIYLLVFLYQLLLVLFHQSFLIFLIFLLTILLSLGLLQLVL